MKLEEISQAFPQTNIKLNEPLSLYTFTHTGGPADALIFPKDRHELEAVVKWLADNQLQWTVLGNASNLIVRDGGFRHAVIMLTEMNEIKVDDQSLIAESGARIIQVAEAAQQAGLSGLEFAYGIPGSVGGAVYMNAGAYGGEIKDCVDEVLVLQADGQLKQYSQQEMGFDYRHSRLQASNDIIVEARFNLEPADKELIWEKMDELMTLRRNKQPLDYPSCGSVFKRPAGYFAGQLIQDAGLQGKQIGGVKVSDKHAGFMVNVDQGTATDYVQLIHYVQKEVKDQFGVDLETEVRIIGEEK